MATAIAFIVWVLLIACPSSCDCRAILGLSVWVVMWSGLNRVRLLPRLLRIPCGFVFFPHNCPVPSHPCRSLLASLSSPHISCPLFGGMLPSVFRPILSSITPRLPCRVNGADFLNASNSMPLKMWLCSGSFIAACLPSDVFHAARRLISSSHRDVPHPPCLPLPHPIMV